VAGANLMGISRR